MSPAFRLWSTSVLVVVAGLAPPLAAQQLLLPADGQPPFAGSGWNAGGEVLLAEDVNADGWPDMLRGHGGSLQAALNNGHGVFRLAPPILAGSMHAMAVGDLDGDGDVDVATASIDWVNEVNTDFGDGTGQFTVGATMDVAVPISLALADFDLDGALDVAVGQKVPGNSFSTLKGLGDGLLGVGIPHGSVGMLGGVAAGDWDLDGDADVFAGSGAWNGLYLGDGAGGFISGPVADGFYGQEVALADMNNDGWLDALSAYDHSPLGETHVGYRKNIAGAFGPYAKLAVSEAQNLCVERNPADGLPDILIGAHTFGDSGKATRISNGPEGLDFLSLSFSHFSLIDETSVAIADMNGDGLSDPILDGVVYFGEADNTVGLGKSFSVLGSVTLCSLVLADLDGNARPDPVAVDLDGDQLFVATGAVATGGGNPFSSWKSVQTGNKPVDVGVLDADDDGLTDAVVACGGLTNGLALHLGTGAATMDGPIITPIGHVPEHLAIGDLDGDARADALVLADDLAAVWLSTGAASFTQGGSADLGTGEHRLALGDLNHDGDLDAIASSNKDLLLAFGDGTGQLGAPVTLTPLTIEGDVVVADFNADGLADIVAHCLGGPGAMALFVANGADGYAAPVLGGIPRSDEVGLIAADIDDDGALDVAYAGTYEAEAYVARGDGHGGWHAGTAHPVAIGYGPRALAAADLDQDGRTDLLHVGSLEDRLTLLSRLGSADNPWASIGGGIPGAVGQPRLMATGDPAPGQILHLEVAHVRPGALALLVAGVGFLDQPFKGGHLVPVPTIVTPVGAADGLGQLHLAGAWPPSVPSGAKIWLQVFFADPGAVHGFSATGGTRLIVP
jgi:FG-GAP-like repeat